MTTTLERERVSVTLDASPFLQAIRAASIVASKDTLRPILAGVLLDCDATGARIVATDSYRLVVIPLTDDCQSEASVVIPHDIVRPLCKAYAKTAAARIVGSVTVTREDDDVTVTVHGADSVATYNGKDPGPYPEYRALIPEAAMTCDEPYAMRADMLASVAKIASELGVEMPVARIVSMTTAMKPCMLEIVGQVSRVLAMYLQMPVQA